MLIYGILSIIIFLIILFYKKNINLACFSFVGLILLYILYGFRVIPNSIFHFDYSKFLYLIAIIIFTNIIYYFFNKLLNTEIGNNIKNTFIILFPNNEMRYLVIFLIGLIHISPFFIINVLIVYFISRMLRLSNFFTTTIILFTTIINNLLFYLEEIQIASNISIFLLLTIILIGMGLTIILISTNYKLENTLQDIIAKNNIIIASIFILFSFIFLLIAKQFGLNVGINYAVLICLGFLSIMSNKNKDTDELEVVKIQHKYPYLISIFIIAINIFIICLPTIFKNYMFELLIVQIFIFTIFNLIINGFLKLKPLDEKIKYYGLSWKNNLLLISACLSIVLIYVLISNSQFNDNNINQSIINNIILHLNSCENNFLLLLNIICYSPFIMTVEVLLNGSLLANFVNPCTLYIASIIPMMPMSIAIIYALFEDKPKQFIDSYKFALLFLIIILFLISIFLVGAP